MKPRLALRVLAIVVTALGLYACAPPKPKTALGGGDPGRGKTLMVREACGACHEIPGVQAANGEVGPPLTGFGRRTMVAGLLPNTPQNLAQWIRTPQTFVPGNAMPNVALSVQETADMAANLETLN